LVYGGVRTAGDNIPINSRKKHREYLKQNGLAMASDYSPAYQEREAARREREEDRKVRTQVDRDVHKIFGG
jgi:Skp family chaperone for outer membrane proteins